MNLRVVGYNTSDAFKSGLIPQQMQNQSIKAFLESNGHFFLLSWSEQKGSAPLVFRSLLHEDFYDGICFYSIEQLNGFGRERKWFEELAARKIWIGFAREGIFFQGEVGRREAESLWYWKKTLESPRGDLKLDCLQK